jgi:thiamine-phosphate pyrophosphorylase
MTSITLLSPFLNETELFAAHLEEACATRIPQALILRFMPMDERRMINAIKYLAPIAQNNNIAVLAQVTSSVAIRGGADGVHLEKGPERIKELAQALKPARMVGIGGITSRDESMMAGEMGADYIMFGEPDIEGNMSNLEQVIELASWWSELFEIPCIAFAPALKTIPFLAKTGAEFIGLSDAVWLHEGGITQALTQAAQYLAKQN